MARGRCARIAVVLGCVLFSSSASASAYSEFNAGVALHGRNNALSIQHLTAALADPGLLRSLRPVALLDRADAYLGESNIEAALDDYSASIALRPSYDALVRRADLLAAMDRTEMALSDLQKANELRPDLLIARVNRVAIFLDRERFDDALNEETALIDLAPRDPTLFSLRSAIYRRQNRLDLALADADYAISVGPRVANGHYARTLALEAGGRFDEALAAIDLEISQLPGRVIPMMKRGIILWEAKRFDDAEKAFSDVAKLAPSNGYAALWRVIVHLSVDVDRPVDPAVLEKVDADAWPGPLTSFFRGEIATDAVLRKAQADFLKRRSRVCEANFYMAQWHLLHAKPALAQPLLRKAVSGCPYDFSERAIVVRQANP